VPRRYARVPLESPLRAQIDGAQTGMARVKTISLGGGLSGVAEETDGGRFDQTGDSYRASQDTFHSGGEEYWAARNGVEFVHMKDEDREKLRKLVQRHLQL